MSAARYLIGDTREVVEGLPDGSIDLVLTSPPFLALRSYLPADHHDKGREIGSEPTPADFLDVLLDLTVLWRRKLAPHGSIVVELGDTYSGNYESGFHRVSDDYSPTPGHTRGGTANGRERDRSRGWPLDKSLCGIPTLYAWSLAYGRNLLRPEHTIEPWRVRNVVVWARPNPPVGALCVDDTTECLTPDGWRRHDEMHDGDLIAAYDPRTDSCRFLPAKFVRYEREAESMVVIDKKATSQWMTEDHRVWTRTRKTAPHVRLARDLTNDCETLLCAPFDDVPGPLPVTSERAALLGWFIAEGTPHHHQARIVQSQTANPHKVERIRSLLEADGADFSERSSVASYNDSTIVTFAVKGELAAWLNLHHKRLPMAYVTTWPEECALALFDALVDGDGHRRAHRGVLFHQKDEAVADAMQVLAIRLGYRASKSWQPSLNLWQITMSASQVKDRRWTKIRKWEGEGIRREVYTGTVWCPMVETSFWLARREGKTFITGNSDKFRPATSYLTVATVARDRWFDLDAVREPLADSPGNRYPRKATADDAARGKVGANKQTNAVVHANPAGAPPLDWWEVPTEPYEGSHYATWPRKLLTRPIQSMCPREVCTACGQPRRRIVEQTEAYAEFRAEQNASYARRDNSRLGAREASGSPGAFDKSGEGARVEQYRTLGWSDCGCGAPWRRGVVLDPFAGSGTTLAVATGLGRDAIGVDLDERNADLARDRVGMFLDVEHNQPTELSA